MGLETVEIIMQCEDEFGIKYPDHLGAHVITVGDFYSQILLQVQEHGKPELRAKPDLEDYLWQRIQTIFAEASWAHHYREPSHILRTTRITQDLKL